jgi:hypothetical protein
MEDSFQRIEIERLAWAGPVTLLASVLAVLAVRVVAVLLVQPAPRFAPLGWLAPTLDTTILVSFAM